MKKRLLLAGAGHAHMTVMARLNEITSLGHQVIAVGPSPRHYYSGMGPGMLGGSYTPEEISFPVKEMIESNGGRFIQGYVKGFDPQSRLLHLESGESLEYDLVSFNTGSRIPDHMVAGPSPDIYPVKPIENLQKARERILTLARERQVRVGVVGGGPGALEVAGNAWSAARENGGKGALVSVYGGMRFLRRVHPGVEKIARRVFGQRGIEVVEGGYVDQVAGGQVRLPSGETVEHDLVFIASGVKPRPIFESSGVPVGDDGGLLVNRYLQCPDYPEIFGGGDCIWFRDSPLDKVGVYAVRQNPILFHNLMASLQGKELQAFEPGGEYLLIFNLGGGLGIFVKWGMVFGGRAAFWFKDRLDRKFIKAFKPEE